MLFVHLSVLYLHVQGAHVVVDWSDCCYLPYSIHFPKLLCQFFFSRENGQSTKIFEVHHFRMIQKWLRLPGAQSVILRELLQGWFPRMSCRHKCKHKHISTRRSTCINRDNTSTSMHCGCASGCACACIIPVHTSFFLYYAHILALYLWTSLYSVKYLDTSLK